MPLVAPIDKIAFAREASSLSKTGSPTPAGIPVTTHSTIPPTELFSLIALSSRACAFSAAFLSGIQSGLLNLSFISMVISMVSISTSPIALA